MSETDKPNKTQADDNPAPPILTEKQKPQARPAPQRRGGGFTLLIALLALLIGAASGGWQAYQYWLSQTSGPAEQPWREDLNALSAKLRDQRESERDEALARVREQMNAQDADLQEALNRQQLATQSQLQEQQQQANRLAGTLAEQERRLNELARLNRDDWILAEAEYLMRLAQQRLALGADVSQASNLMQAAQRNLQMVQDAKAQTVLEVLERDLQNLRKVEQFDLGALHARVESVAAAAQDLLPLAERSVTPQAVAETAEPAPEITWKNTWAIIKYGVARAAERLNSYIRVSDRDSQYQRTVIAGGQRELFQQNLQLMFEQAQWALLSGNETLYQQALKRCDEWLRRYYRQGEAEQAVLHKLEALGNTPVRPPAPPLNASLNAISEFIDQRHTEVAP